MLPHAPFSVIIPTLASAQRALPLQRAIGSIRLASREAVHILVVVNGPHFDPALCQWLLAQPDVIDGNYSIKWLEEWLAAEEAKG